MLDERTELLAKLMATENIDVQQTSAKTAYFDTDKRVLVLPNWVNLSRMETEMLVGHEVGHALFTPAKPWITAIESFDGNKKVFKHVMNVIEDPRIERAIKKKYPGMRKIFYFGYEELFDRGIFTEDMDPKELTLIDKLNFQFKIPGKVQFDTDEQFWDLVKRIDACEDFDSVVALSKEIYALCELEYEQNQQSNQGKESAEAAESEGEENESQSGPATSNSQPESPKNQKAGKKGEKDKEAADNTTPKKVEQSFEDKYTPTMEKQLEGFLEANRDTRRRSYMELPEPILENILITNRELQKHLAGYKWNEGADRPVMTPNFRELYEDSKEDKEDPIDLSSISSSIKKFNKEHAASIAYLTKVFDMKKKAKEYKNTLRFKTGKLDMNRLTKYKFEDDIFLTTQVKQKGKNHGIVFYLDMSSSMGDIFKQTLTQLLEILLFCRGCGIPASVYGFADNSSVIHYVQNRAGKEPNVYYTVLEQFETKGSNKTPYGQFALIELFSPSMTKKEFTNTFELFLSNKWRYVDWFYLNGTPLAPAVNTLEAIVNRFRNMTRSEIVNVVFLTDGGDTSGGEFGDITGYRGEAVLVDPKKKTRVTSEYLKTRYQGTHMFQNYSYMVPAAILNLMKKRLPGVSFVNFFISRWFSTKLYCVDTKATMEFDEMYYVQPDAFGKAKDFSRMYMDSMEDVKQRFLEVNRAKQEKRTMANSFIEKMAK